MDNERIASELVKLASDLMAADTFECPDCGTKVLDQTEYCVKCQKKVKEAAEGEFKKIDSQMNSIASKLLKETGGDLGKMMTVVVMALKKGGHSSEATTLYNKFRPLMKKFE